MDVESKLKAAALDSLPVYWRAQPTLCQLLEVDNKAAKDASPQRSAFTCVDHTHKDLLPLWMSSEAVGGHTLRPGELERDLNADSPRWAGHPKELWKNQATSEAWCSGERYCANGSGVRV